MTSQIKLLTSSVSLILITSIFIVLLIPKGQNESEKASFYTQVVADAKTLYFKEKMLGRDFTTSSCLTQQLRKGWAVDIVSNPRQPIDDLTASQCDAIQDGRYPKKIIELDLDGNFIRILE